MLDLTVNGGLAAKLVEELSKDKDVVRACKGDIDISYGDGSCGIGGPEYGKVFDGTHLGLHLVRKASSLEYYLIGKEYYASNLKSALLVTFSVASECLECFDGEPVGEVVAAAKLNLIKEKVDEVFPGVLEEYIKTVNSLENADYVQYKLLSVGSGALHFASPNAINETGDFLLSFYRHVEKEGWCVAEKGFEIPSILDNIWFYNAKFVNLAGLVIVWRRKGEETISASFIGDFAQTGPSFSNGGREHVGCKVRDVRTYDYTYESVANEGFFLDFEEQKVKAVSDVADTDTYLGIGYDDNESWMVFADGAHCVSVFDCRAFRNFHAAYEAMNESVAELLIREFYFNKYIGKTSSFGLENIVRQRVRVAAERL